MSNSVVWVSGSRVLQPRLPRNKVILTQTHTETLKTNY